MPKTERTNEELTNDMPAIMMASMLARLIQEVQKGHRVCTLELVRELTGLHPVDCILVVRSVWQALEERPAYRAGVVSGAAVTLEKVGQALANQEAQEAVPVSYRVVPSAPMLTTGQEKG